MPSFRAAATPLIAATALTCPTVALATPPDLVGFGTRSPGLAMTGVASGDSYEAAFNNPALLATMRRRSIFFGASLTNFDVRIDDESAGLEPARGTTIGFTLPLPFGDFLEDRLTVGAGFYTPTNVLLRGDVRFIDVPQWPVLGRSQSLSLHVGLGLDLHGVVDGLRIGVGVSAMAALTGDLTVSLDETNAFQSVVETQLLARFAPIVGATYAQRDWSVGLVYHHEIRADMDLRIVTRDLPLRLPILTIGGLIQYDPSRLALEGTYAPIPELRLIANVTARFWDAYPGPTRPTTSMSFAPPRPEFHPTLSPRVAVEATLTRLPFEVQVRGGYAFEMSPAPPARLAAQLNPDGTPRMNADGSVALGPLRLLDNDRHVATLGVGASARLSATERVVLDAFGQAHFMASRTHEVGRSEAAGALETSGIVWVGGWSVGLEF